MRTYVFLFAASFICNVVKIRVKYSLNLLWLSPLLTENIRCEGHLKFFPSTQLFSQICFLRGTSGFLFFPMAAVFAEHLFYLVPRFNLKCQMKEEELSISRGQTEAATHSKREGWQMPSAGPGRWGRIELCPASASKGCGSRSFRMEAASTWNSCNLILEAGLIYSGEPRKDLVSKERVANTNINSQLHRSDCH